MAASLPRRLSALDSNPSVVCFAPSTAPADFLYGCLEAPLIPNICRFESSTSAGNATCGTANRPFVLWRFTFRPLATPRVAPSVLSPRTSLLNDPHAPRPPVQTPLGKSCRTFGMNEPSDGSPHSGPGRSSRAETRRREGDAETGTGVEVGGGMRYEGDRWSMEGSVRTLLRD